MKFFFTNQKFFKNGLLLDYIYKNIIFFFYKNFIGNNFFIIIDKYLINAFILSIKSLFNFFFFLLII